tara:strand:+ start:5354 stop:5887 length:534 start_codon:yes stop_codon:yes gene_type:complete
MAENWAAIAAEVDAALKSVGSTDAGFSATLMQSTTTGGEPWDPTGGTTVQTYSTVTVVQGVREIRDLSGTVIIETRRTLMISAAGVAPTKQHRIAVGVAAAEAQAAAEYAEATGFPDTTIYSEIIEVRPLSPAGIAVLYEVDLGGGMEGAASSGQPSLDFTFRGNSMYAALIEEANN